MTHSTKRAAEIVRALLPHLFPETGCDLSAAQHQRAAIDKVSAILALPDTGEPTDLGASGGLGQPGSGSREEADVGATAALAQLKVGLENRNIDVSGTTDPVVAALVAISHYQAEREGNPLANVESVLASPPPMGDQGALVITEEMVERAAQAIVDERWNGTQPGFDGKPPGWKTGHMAEARAALTAALTPHRQEG